MPKPRMQGMRSSKRRGVRSLKHLPVPKGRMYKQNPWMPCRLHFEKRLGCTFVGMLILLGTMSFRDVQRNGAETSNGTTHTKLWILRNKLLMMPTHLLKNEYAEAWALWMSLETFLVCKLPKHIYSLGNNWAQLP